MAYNDKLAYAPQDADGVVQDIKGYKDVGYNGELGIVAPNIYFKGDFEEELATQSFHEVPKAWGEMAKVDKEKGQQDGYKNLSFKSADGTNESYNQASEDYWTEEDPKDYKWTQAYYDCPQIASMIDWFQCEMTRVRIFQQQPGHVMPLHTDFDNQKGMTHGQTVRIFVQLNDNSNADFGFRFQTSDSDISLNLQKGQWLAFNQDKVAHSTWNLSKDRVRNAFMFVAKRNEWLDNIMKHQGAPVVVDCKELAKNRSKRVA
jgi:hypothetical protein